MKKLFVSSTFKDMQLERDSLKKHIIPNLNMRLRDFGVKISQTDLRWGISTSELSVEEGEQKVLNVCLDEINKSRPYMIVIIGERYGWMPSSAIIDMNAKGRGIDLEDNDISVTQLEIEYIAFTKKWDESRIFFYFRDFDYGDMDSAMRSSYVSESRSAEEKLLALKARIRAKFPDRIRNYSLKYENGEIRGIERFEELVRDDLYGLFLRDAEEDDRKNVNVLVRDKLHREALLNFEVYKPQYDLRTVMGSNMLAWNQKSEQTHTYIGGAARSGKTLSVEAHYTALYAYLNKEEAIWEAVKPLFDPVLPPLNSDSMFTAWFKCFDPDNTFPLYLALGNSKNIADSYAFFRTLLYHLNEYIGRDIDIPADKDGVIAELAASIRRLSASGKCFYLFADDLNAEALSDLFCLEHSFSDSEIEGILKHFLFYVSFDSSFDKPPVYVPFFGYSECKREDKSGIIPAEYFFSYAKKLGKELSSGVIKYINGYYGGYGLSYDDAGLNHITKSHANLMANYFMNLTSDDYRRIRELGNDMNAIEARQLELLRAVKGNFSDDYSGESMRKVTLLNFEKFEADHSERTLRMMGLIYILSGIPFSMEEAEWLYSYFGEEWSDLEFISYFDDFREFFVYKSEDDSYKALPEFAKALRQRTVDKYFGNDASGAAAITEALKHAPFFEKKRQYLFYPVLLSGDREHIRGCFTEMAAAAENDFLVGKTLGESVSALLHRLSENEITEIGRALSDLISSSMTYSAMLGFFSGLGKYTEDHDYAKKAESLADALLYRLSTREGETIASAVLSVTLLRAYCYLGWHNYRAIEILLSDIETVARSGIEVRVEYLSVLSSLLRKFDEQSPMFARIRGVILAHLPKMGDIVCEDKTARIYADLYTLAYFVKSFSLSAGFYEPKELLLPFMNKENLKKLGLRNIDTAILAIDAYEMPMEEIVSRTRMIMESLAADFPSGNYAARLIGSAMLARLFNVPMAVGEDKINAALEKHYYPYQKAVLRSDDNSAYHFINYGNFLQNSKYFHFKTKITRNYDEEYWEATGMGNWTNLYFNKREASIDVIIEVCCVYISYLRDPKFYDMISNKGENQYGEEGVAEPSLNALHYRLTSYLAAVLHNPETRIMKPKLKRIFAKLEEHYGDYMKSLSGTRYKIVKKFIESL